MIIEGVTIQNVGRHASRNDDTDAATVGVLGPNGEGKSTWIDVLRICLTGGARDTLNTYMRDGGVHGKTLMSVRFRKNGKRGTITRTISKTASTRVLEWDGQTYKAAAQVDEILAGILNADKRAVMNCVFVPQGELNKILFGDATERRAQFTRMLGCGHYDAVARAAQQQAAKLRADTVDLEPTRVEIAAQVEGHSLRFTALGQELAVLPDNSAEIARLTQSRNFKQAKQGITAKLEQSRSNVVNMLRQVRIDAAFEHASEVMRVENETAKYRHARYENLTQERTSAQRVRSDTLFLIDTLEPYVAAKQAFEALASAPPLPLSSQAEIQTYMSALQAITTRQGELTGIQSKQVQYVELEKNLTALEVEISGLKQRKAALDTDVKEHTKVHAAAVNNPRIGLLKMQVDILTDVRKHRTDLSKHMQSCPLCQSTTGLANMTLETMDAALASARAELDALDAVREAAAVKLNGVLSLERQNELDLTRCQSREAVDRKTLGELQHENVMGVDVAVEKAQLDARAAEIQGHLANLKQAEEKRETEIRRRTSISTTWEALARQAAGREELLQEAITRRSTRASCEGYLQFLDVSAAKIQEELESLTRADASFKSWWNYLVNEGASYNKLLADDAAMGTDAAPDLTLEAAQLELTRLEQAEQKRRELTASRAELQTAVNQCNQRLAELDRRQQAQHNKIMLANQMDTVARVFGREGVVRLFMADVFDRLLTLVEPHLTMLAAPFVVHRSEDPLSFEFKRTDEESVWQPDYKLSGGQRVKMTVAFLLALHQLIIPDVGLMVLDEPTVHLDADSRENVRDLFENLGNVLERTECQLIVCDHCPEILPALKKKVMIRRPEAVVQI